MVDFLALSLIKARGNVPRCCHQQHNGRHALLTVDEQPFGESGALALRGDVDDRPEEMLGIVDSFSDALDVIPELLAVLLIPLVVALEDWYYELYAASNQFGVPALVGFHKLTYPVTFTTLRED